MKELKLDIVAVSEEDLSRRKLWLIELTDKGCIRRGALAFEFLYDLSIVS